MTVSLYIMASPRRFERPTPSLGVGFYSKTPYTSKYHYEQVYLLYQIVELNILCFVVHQKPLWYIQNVLHECSMIHRG